MRTNNKNKSKDNKVYKNTGNYNLINEATPFRFKIEILF